MHIPTRTNTHSHPRTCLGQDPETDKKGIEAVEAVLKDARRIAKSLPAAKRATVEKICSEIEALTKELADLQARGLVSSVDVAM